MIDLAKQLNGVILTRDHFKDIREAADAETAEVINFNCLSFMFVLGPFV